MPDLDATSTALNYRIAIGPVVAVISGLLIVNRTIEMAKCRKCGLCYSGTKEQFSFFCAGRFDYIVCTTGLASATILAGKLATIDDPSTGNGGSLHRLVRRGQFISTHLGSAHAIVRIAVNTVSAPSRSDQNASLLFVQ